MKRLVISLVLFFLVLSVFGQSFKKGKVAVGKNSFSYWYTEPAQKITGILVLLPGLGESPASIFEKTSLPNLLSKKGISTIIPQLNHSLFGDETILVQIDKLIADHSKTHQLDTLDLWIGGLSAGGTIALAYAEHEMATKNQFKLKGVFAIDSPLDLVCFYRSAEAKIAYSCNNPLIRKEGLAIRQSLIRAMGGTPEEQPENYRKYSAFDGNSEDGGNAKYLTHLPIRLYTEPDLEFVRKTYCEALQPQDINAYDMERFHHFLLQLGNRQAEYITTVGRGFHSWNILDAEECANWMIGLSSK